MAVGTRIRLSLIGALAALLAGGVLPATASAAPEPTPAAGAARWTAAKLPSGNTVLTGSTRPDARTTWAAGFRVVPGSDGTVGFDPVLYARDDRRDGKWTEVPTAPAGTDRINAVAATSARDGWLVGDSGRGGGPVMTQHWNGRSWQLEPAPMPVDSVGGGLLGIAALTPNNAWAAGWSQGPDGHVGIVQHWNGRSWRQVELPAPFRSWGLGAIAAAGPDDVWAVGNGYSEDDRPVALHFDGRGWSVVPVPAFGGLYGEFNDVVVKGPRDVWAVGRVVLDEKDRGHALLMHWDGRAWTRVEAPEGAGAVSGAASSPDGIVTVGRVSGGGEAAYALRVTGSRATSLGFPESGAGTAYWSWKVSTTGREVTVTGAFNYEKQQLPQPMVMTTRL
ncbi:WD40/YVTN/BNR-like repeat-containing protein [Kitasatospora purpeofusca]|uniref:WD40/YVTN/BNR-like repeat-containing protein n=1 Tax=Kitasatospora purpeofusca TaxID=67352 RepID=UPI0036B501FF